MLTSAPIRIALIFLCVFGSSAQIKAYKAQDTAAINKMLREVVALIPADREKALKLTRAAYETSERSGYRQGRAKSALLLGTYEMRRSHYQEASSYYQEAVEIARSLDLQEELAQAYTLLGINQGMQNNSAKALGWFLMASRLYQDAGDRQKVADIDYKIGLVYGQVNDFKTAVSYMKRSLDYAEQTGDSNLEMNVLNNLGVVYGRMEDYKASADALHRVHALSKRAGNSDMYLHIYQNLGNVYRELGMFDSSRYYLDLALDLNRKADYPIGIAGTTNAYADLYVRQHRYAEALKYIDTSMALAAAFDDKDLLYSNNLLLQKVYTALGRYKEAALLADTIMALNKLVEGAEKRALVEQAGMNAELERVSDSLKTMEAEARDKTRQRNLFIGIAAIMLLSAVAAFLTIRHIREKNRKLARKKAELEESGVQKDKIFAVISHDLRSPLGSIIGSLELFESGMLNEQEQRGLIADLHLSASATLETLDNLLRWGSSQFRNHSVHLEAVDLKAMTEGTKRLLSSVAAHKSIRLEDKVDELCIARFDRDQMAFILRNLIANAIKFSHEGQKIEVRGKRANGRIILQVEDAGVGMPESVRERLFDAREMISARGTAGERGVGLGLILIKEFLDKNDGDITVRSAEGKGSCFEVSVPAV